MADDERFPLAIYRCNHQLGGCCLLKNSNFSIIRIYIIPVGAPEISELNSEFSFIDRDHGLWGKNRREGAFVVEQGVLFELVNMRDHSPRAKAGGF